MYDCCSLSISLAAVLPSSLRCSGSNPSEGHLRIHKIYCNSQGFPMVPITIPSCNFFGISNRGTRIGPEILFWRTFPKQKHRRIPALFHSSLPENPCIFMCIFDLRCPYRWLGDCRRPRHHLRVVVSSPSLKSYSVGLQ